MKAMIMIELTWVFIMLALAIATVVLLLRPKRTWKQLLKKQKFSEKDFQWMMTNSLVANESLFIETFGGPREYIRKNYGGEIYQRIADLKIVFSYRITSFAGLMKATDFKMTERAAGHLRGAVEAYNELVALRTWIDNNVNTILRTGN